MDELQMSFLRNNIVVWAISSHTDEIFTPIGRLEKICTEIFSSKKFIRKKISIEIPAQNNFPLVTQRKFLMYFFENEKKYKSSIEKWIKDMDIANIKDENMEKVMLE